MTRYHIEKTTKKLTACGHDFIEQDYVAVWACFALSALFEVGVNE